MVMMLTSKPEIVYRLESRGAMVAKEGKKTLEDRVFIDNKTVCFYQYYY